MIKYCEECGKEVETKIVNKKEIYNVLGEDFEVDAQVLVCADCGEEFFCEELDNATLVNAYNKHRQKHKLLLPNEIKSIREQYRMSQRSFAKLLNWGDKTICRYENGSIQDRAHNSLLQFLREPHNMKKYLMENEVALSEKQKKKLCETISELEREKYKGARYFLNHIFTYAPDEENGYRSFDYDKFCSMVLFFAHKSDELLKTKLMKLLNYSDMISYRDNGFSISGLRYVHLPYGPVPDYFDFLLAAMAEDHIVHIEVNYDNGYEKHQVVPERDVVQGVLSKEELAVMNRVYEKFINCGSVDISNYSHHEKGYINTKQGEIISYSYAKDIEL